MRREGRAGTVRRLGAALLIFALLLQGMTFAVAAGRVAAGASQDGFAFCSHSVAAENAGTSAPSGTPANPETDRHCVFCLAGTSFLLDVQDRSAEFSIIAFATVLWTFTAWRLPALTVDASARPRGPPTVI